MSLIRCLLLNILRVSQYMYVFTISFLYFSGQNDRALSRTAVLSRPAALSRPVEGAPRDEFLGDLYKKQKDWDHWPDFWTPAVRFAGRQ